MSQLFLTCGIKLVADSWVVCVPQTTPPLVTERAINLPFSVWDPSSLAVYRSRVFYSFPNKPEVYNISGCAGPKLDVSINPSVLVFASNCPTKGGAKITVVGKNFIPPFSASVYTPRGSTLCPLDPANLNMARDTNFTQFVCILPQLTGERLLLQVRSVV
jgi:hypothetical protein